jgi:hypothetical protein
MLTALPHALLVRLCIDAHNLTGVVGDEIQSTLTAIEYHFSRSLLEGYRRDFSEAKVDAKSDPAESPSPRLRPESVWDRMLRDPFAVQRELKSGAALQCLGPPSAELSRKRQRASGVDHDPAAWLHRTRSG